MFFQVQELAVRPARFEVEIPLGVIDFQQGARDREANLRQAGPLKAEGKAELVVGSLGEIRVSGHASVPMEADCDRCLEPARVAVDSDFSLFYRPVSEGYGDEKEIDAGEAEMGFYQGQGLELNEVLREFVLLTMPMQHLCSEGCRGICPSCGQNRNLKDCQCQAEVRDDRWAALKNFK